MTITVNNVLVTVDEDMVTLNDPDEVGSFSPFNASLTTALGNITKAPTTADFTATQIAAQNGFFTIGANTTDLRFVANAGNPPTGFPVGGTAGVDSGLKTADGTSIYLFQSADTNNMVYGAIGNNAANAAAFVLVLDEQLTGGNVTNAKMWILQYAAVQHDDHNVTEGDLVDLANKVYVASTAVSTSVFSDFADVPAGAPVFAMIADDTNANPIDYLVTAFAADDPATPSNESLSLLTLNISNQGSFPGSLASGSQNITPGTGLRFDLVTGGNNTNDSKTDAGIAYGTHTNVVQAGFTIVQNQGGRPTDIKVQAYDSLSDTAQGHAYTTALGNQTALSVDRVRVTVLDSTGAVVQTITDTTATNAFATFNADGSVTVKDALLNWQIEIFRAGGFDRFTATNVDAQQNAYIDIGRLTFTTSQTLNDAQEVGSKMQFDDSGPTIGTTGVVGPLDVDDSGLAGGTTPSAALLTDTVSVAANFTSAYGSDGPGTFTYAMKVVNGDDSGLNDAGTGQDILLRLNAAGAVEGYTAGSNQVVFNVSVASNGVVTLNLLRAIKHDVGDSVETMLAAKIKVTGTVTDREGAVTGDQVSTDLPIGDKLNFHDDEPTVTAQDAPINTLNVDDDTLGAPGADTIDASGLFTKVYGADGADATTPLSYALSTTDGPSGVFDVKTGLQVQLKTVAGVVHGVVNDGGEVDVFTVSVSGAGIVTLTQQRAIRHTDTGTPTDASQDPTGLVGSELIKLTATIKDKDGDTASDTADLTGAIQFNDGQPSITAPPSPGGSAGAALQVNNTAGANATGTFGFDIGPDKPGTYGSGVSDFVDANANVAGVQLSLAGSVTGPPSTAITNASVTLASETADSAVFNFSFDYDRDPLTNGVQTGTATGTLTFDKDDDTYTVAIVNPVQGFSFNVLHTTELLAKQPVGNTGHPPIVVEKLAVDDPNTAGFDEDFYVQFTADTTPLGFSTTGNVSGSADKAFNGASHDLAGGVETWVSATQSTNGVAGDTIGKQELLSLRFFNSDILGDVATGTEKTDPTATASGITLKFDGIGASEDLIMILDLIDPSKALNDPTREITRAVIVDNADIFKLSNGGVPAPYNTEFSLDNNDGLVIIESNDYNGTGEHYQIQGVQIMQGPNGLTGQGINLNPAVGAAGGSSTTSGLQAFGGNVNDVLKIVDIGFVQMASGTQGANLDFSLQIRDADNDLTTTQHLFVDFLV